MNNKPIGIFDSGLGGTSIWQEVIKLMPNEPTLYLADSKNAPYGHKSKEEIIALSIKNTEFLLSKGCKLIIVACNTATTNAISILRNKYSIPFIGIEPAIKPAALNTKTKNVGVLATKGTLTSSLFHETSAKYYATINKIEVDGEGLVQLIESGNINSSEVDDLLKKCMKPMLKQNIDCLVLGCTHYPYLIPQIKKIVGSKVTIIDSGSAVAKQTQSILSKNNLLNNTTNIVDYTFITNGDKSTLKNLLKHIKTPILIKRQNF